MLGFKHRTSKKWKITPLSDKTVTAKRGGGMEREEEVRGPIANTFKEGSVQACDSSPAFKAANKKVASLKNVPIVTVVHGRKQFVKACRLKVSEMSKKLKAGLKVKQGQRVVNVAAGDNCVEGLFGSAKAGMRRVDMMGRRTAPRAHINFLASCWQLRKPGFYGVLEAFRIHREGVQDTIAPADTYKDTSWLGVDEKKKTKAAARATSMEKKKKVAARATSMKKKKIASNGKLMNKGRTMLKMRKTAKAMKKGRK